MNKINDTTYNLATAKPNTTREAIEVLVGDPKAAEFKPQIDISKWDGEVTMKISLPETEKITPYLDTDQKLKWEGATKDIHFYEIGKTQLDTKSVMGVIDQHEEGGFEFEIILKEKPATNVISFDIETEGLQFLYQPFLTNEEKLSMNVFRPANAEGSYAVYHASKKNNQYKTGKVGHFYRPQMVDSAGTKVWGELNIDEANGKLTVTIPQSFLDNAVYPVHHAAGLTFGYTTIGVGGSTFQSSVVALLVSGAAGDGVSVSAYYQAVNTTDKFKHKLYLESDGSAVANSETSEFTGDTSLGWHTANFVSTPTFTATSYRLCYFHSLLAKTLPALYYDTGAPAANVEQYSATYGTWPTDLTATPINSFSYYLSMYVTYTESAPAGVPVAWLTA